MAFTGVWVTQVFLTSAQTFANTPAAGCRMRSCMLSLFISVGGRGWGGLTSLCKALVAWCVTRGGYFWQREREGCCLRLFCFLTGVWMYVNVCLWYAHTHTHTARGVLGCEIGGRNKTPGGPEESRWSKFQHMCIRTCAQSTHVYIDAKRRDEILDSFFFNTFFLPKKKSKRCDAILKTRIRMDLSYIELIWDDVKLA